MTQEVLFSASSSRLFLQAAPAPAPKRREILHLCFFKNTTPILAVRNILIRQIYSFKRQIKKKWFQGWGARASHKVFFSSCSSSMEPKTPGSPGREPFVQK